MNQFTGKYLMLAGLALLVLGALFYFAGNKLSWIGRLPGDIRVEKQNFRFYFPLTTMILFSVLLNIIIVVVKKK